MKASLAAFCALVPVLVAAADEAPRLEDLTARPLRDVSIDALVWQAGQWRGTEGEHSTIQWIGCPAGGLMLGVQHDLAGGRTRFFEFQRYAEVDGGLVFYAQPLGRSATPFVLIQLGEQHAVFENRRHDYPQRIVMRRVGAELIGRIEGEVDGELRSSEWRWQLQRPAAECESQ